MNEIDSVANEILSNDSFLITSHANPDCDALGSTLALGSALESLGKHVELYNTDGTPAHLEFLPGSKKIIDDLASLYNKKYDYYILLDCTDIYRPGIKFAEYIEKQGDCKLIFIDHHDTNNGNNTIKYLDKDAASTGLLVYKIIKSLDISITKDIADNILATIIGDTGSFRYSNTNSESFKVAGELMDIGADLELISQAIYENEPINKIRLMGEAMNTLEIDSKKQIATIYVTNEMYLKTGTSREDTEGIVNIPRSVGGISVAVFFKQDKNEGNAKKSWKVSLRSKKDVNVAAIAEKFGGGGHIKAAGFNIEGEFENIKNTVIDSISREIE